MMSGATDCPHPMTIPTPAIRHLLSSVTDSTRLMAFLITVISHLMSGASVNSSDDYIRFG